MRVPARSDDKRGQIRRQNRSMKAALTTYSTVCPSAKRNGYVYVLEDYGEAYALRAARRRAAQGVVALEGQKRVNTYDGYVLS